MLIIDNLLSLPLRGTIGIFRKIREMAERELTDENYIREKLMEIQLRFELDELGEEEYSRKEEELMALLDSIKKSEEEREVI